MSTVVDALFEDLRNKLIVVLDNVLSDRRGCRCMATTGSHQLAGSSHASMGAPLRLIVRGHGQRAAAGPAQQQQDGERR
jgi:hypothetical protein